MKFQKTFIALVASASICIFSCQKDPDVDPVEPPSGGPDHNFIARILVLDSSVTSIDTTETITYSYDSQKRVSNIADSFRASSGAWVPFAKETFYYNGVDTLPSNYFKTVIDGIGRDTTSTFFYYNLAAQRTKDSSFRLVYQNAAGSTVLHQEWTTVSSYDYQPGKIIGKTTETVKYIYNNGTTSTTVNNDSDTATFNNGNVVSSIHRQNILRAAITITYNNTPNIYSLFNIRNSYALLPTGSPSLFTVSANNPVSMTTVYSGPVNNTRTCNYFYNYRPDGKLNWVKWENGTSDFEKFIFTYRAL